MDEELFNKYIEELPSIQKNWQNLPVFKSNLTRSLSKLEKRLAQDKHSVEDDSLFRISAKYNINLLIEFYRLKRQDKFNGFRIDREDSEFMLKFHKVQGDLMRYLAQNESENKFKGSYYWWSNIYYSKSAHIGKNLQNSLHVAKQMSNVTKNWLEIYKLKHEARYLSLAKRSFFSVIDGYEKTNNKSLRKDIDDIIYSSTDFEIALIVAGNLTYL